MYQCYASGAGCAFPNAQKFALITQYPQLALCFNCGAGQYPQLAFNNSTNVFNQTCIATASCNYTFNLNGRTVCYQNLAATDNRNTKNCTKYINNAAPYVCQASCAKYDDQDHCVTSCSATSHIFVNGTYCNSTCPSKMYVDSGSEHICTTACAFPKGKYLNYLNSQTRCVDNCADTNLPWMNSSTQ